MQCRMCLTYQQWTAPSCHVVQHHVLWRCEWHLLADLVHDPVAPVAVCVLCMLVDVYYMVCMLVLIYVC